MRAELGGWAEDASSDNIQEVPSGAQAATVPPAPSLDLRLPAANLLPGDHLLLKPPRDPWGSSYLPALSSCPH